MKNLILFLLVVLLAACETADRTLEGNLFDKDFEGDIIKITNMECLPVSGGGQARIYWKILPFAADKLDAIPIEIVTVFMRSIENDGEVQPIYLDDERIHNQVADFDPGLSVFNEMTLNEEYHTRIEFPDLSEMKTIQVIVLVRDEQQAVSSAEDERVYQVFEVGCEL